jgi:hypothetical protein
MPKKAPVKFTYTPLATKGPRVSSGKPLVRATKPARTSRKGKIRTEVQQNAVGIMRAVNKGTVTVEIMRRKFAVSFDQLARSMRETAQYSDARLANRVANDMKQMRREEDADALSLGGLFGASLRSAESAKFWTLYPRPVLEVLYAYTNGFFDSLHEKYGY